MKNHKNELTNLLFLTTHMTERISKVLNEELDRDKMRYRHGLKQQLTRMSDNLKHFHRSVEQFNEMAGCLDADNFDAIWRDANYLCRIACMVCDCTEGDPDVMQKIEAYLLGLKSGEVFDGEFINEQFRVQ